MTLYQKAKAALLDVARRIAEGASQDPLDLATSAAKSVVEKMAAPPPSGSATSPAAAYGTCLKTPFCPLSPGHAGECFSLRETRKLALREPDGLEEFERCGRCNHVKRAHRGGLEDGRLRWDIDGELVHCFEIECGCSEFVSRESPASTPDEKPLSNDSPAKAKIERDGLGEETIVETIQIAIKTIEDGMWCLGAQDIEDDCTYCGMTVADERHAYGTPRSERTLEDHTVLCSGIASLHSLRKAAEDAKVLRANVDRLKRDVERLDRETITILRGATVSIAVAAGAEEAWRGGQARIQELLESNTALLFKLRATDRKTIVREFHAKFDCPIGERPHLLSDDRVRFRMKLIAEEFVEAMRAAYGDSRQEPWRFDRMVEFINFVVEQCPVKVDLCEWADALIDLPFVCEGSLIEAGIDSTPLWTEVAKTNMAKEPAELGKKVKKPPGWAPPDIAGLLKAQGWNGKDGIKR